MQRASALPAKGPRAVRVAFLPGHGVFFTKEENIGSEVGGGPAGTR
jgi:hypothetical protein